MLRPRREVHSDREHDPLTDMCDQQLQLEFFGNVCVGRYCSNKAVTFLA